MEDAYDLASLAYVFDRLFLPGYFMSMDSDPASLPTAFSQTIFECVRSSGIVQIPQTIFKKWSIDEAALPEHLAIKNQESDDDHMLGFIMKQTSWKCTRQQDKDGNTPLHLCAMLNKPQCMQCILTAVPDIASTKNNEGQTAYDIAAAGKYHLCVDLLEVSLGGDKRRKYHEYLGSSDGELQLIKMMKLLKLFESFPTCDREQLRQIFETNDYEFPETIKSLKERGAKYVPILNPGTENIYYEDLIKKLRAAMKAIQQEELELKASTSHSQGKQPRTFNARNTQCTKRQHMETQEKDDEDKVSSVVPKIPKIDYQGPRSEGKEMSEFKERSRSKVTKVKKEVPMATGGRDAESFFMTQVDDQREEEAVGGATSKEVMKRTEEEDMNMNRWDMLAVGDSTPKDMHGKGKARLDRISKAVEPYRKIQQEQLDEPEASTSHSQGKQDRTFNEEPEEDMVDTKSPEFKAAMVKLNDTLTRENIDALMRIAALAKADKLSEDSIVAGIGRHLIYKLAGRALTTNHRSSVPCPCKTPLEPTKEPSPACELNKNLTATQFMFIGSKDTWHGELDLRSEDVGIKALQQVEADEEDENQDKEPKTPKPRMKRESSNGRSVNLEFKKGVEKSTASLDQVQAQAVVYGYTQVNKYPKMSPHIPSLIMDAKQYTVFIYNPKTDSMLQSAGTCAFFKDEKDAKYTLPFDKYLGIVNLWMILHHRLFFRKKIQAEQKSFQFKKRMPQQVVHCEKLLAYSRSIKPNESGCSLKNVIDVRDPESVDLEAMVNKRKLMESNKIEPDPTKDCEDSCP